jgi:uncharacterized protein (TIGR03067 family)
MIRALSASLLFAAAAAAIAANADAEIKALEGEWRIDAARLGGRDHLDDFAGMKLILKGSRFTIEFAENSDRGTFTIDAMKSPKWITIKTDKKGPFFGRTLQGIYKTEKDQLVICCEVDGKTRPTAFEAKEKSRNMLLAYQREKK